MKQEAEFHIIGRQRYEDGQTDKTEQRARGRFYLGEDGIYLQYRESQPEQGEEIPITVKAQPGQVSVLRGGQFRSQMLFCPGQRTSVCYRTPFGALNLEVTTHSLELNLTQQGGKLDLRYQLSSGGLPVSSNRLTIQVMPL